MSGLIFVALALVWAVVLIPKALRHHDEVAKTRGVDTVSDDARVLARRESAAEGGSRLVVRPAARARASILEDRAQHAAWRTERAVTSPVGTTAVARPVGVRAHRKAAAAAARRRRRILGMLLLADLVVGAGVPLGWFLSWAPAVPGGLTVLYLVVARITVRAERRRWEAMRAAARSAAPAAAQEAPQAEPGPLTDRAEGPAQPAAAPPTLGAPAPTAPPAERLEERRNEQGLAVVSSLDDTASFPAGLLGLEPTTDAGSLWDPLPITLPTYVTKPRAPRSVRTIDLRGAGVSSSGRDADDSALVAEAATAAQAADVVAGDRRAVGS